jgi:hypothetical protein
MSAVWNTKKIFGTGKSKRINDTFLTKNKQLLKFVLLFLKQPA